MLALLLLLLPGLGGEQPAPPPLLLEGAVIALVERQLAALEMQNMRGHVVEQIAVMADDDDARRIAREIVDEPERAFEIEIIGRLVEQQQIRLREQHRRQRDAHAPAAGEFRQRAVLRLGVEAEAGRMARRARRRRMGVDIGEPRLDFGDVVRVMRGLASRASRSARSRSAASTKSISAVGPPGASCSTRPSLVPRRKRDCPLSGAISPLMSRNSVVLPAPLRPTKPARERPGRKTPAWSNKQPVAEPVGEIIDREHAVPCRHFAPPAQSPQGCEPNSHASPSKSRAVERRR